jgi:hypothetical protein
MDASKQAGHTAAALAAMAKLFESFQTDNVTY